jgi:hypothetical protein
LSFQALQFVSRAASQSGTSHLRETVMYANDVDTDVTTRVVVVTEVTTCVVLTRFVVGTRLVRMVVVGTIETTVTYMVLFTVTGVPE